VITEETALRRLREAADTATRQALAARLAISPQYLSDVLNGRRSPTQVLARFGLKRVVRYEEAT
jgi:hypothetical protein